MIFWNIKALPTEQWLRRWCTWLLSSSFLFRVARICHRVLLAILLIRDRGECCTLRCYHAGGRMLFRLCLGDIVKLLLPRLFGEHLQHLSLEQVARVPANSATTPMATQLPNLRFVVCVTLRQPGVGVSAHPKDIVIMS